LGPAEVVGRAWVDGGDELVGDLQGDLLALLVGQAGSPYPEPAAVYGEEREEGPELGLRGGGTAAEQVGELVHLLSYPLAGGETP